MSSKNGNGALGASELVRAQDGARGLKVAEVERICEACLFVPRGRVFSSEMDWGLPFVLCGLSGNGKTYMLGRLAKKYGLMFDSAKPGARGEGFFGVTPYFVEEGGRKWIDFPPPKYWHDKFVVRGAGRGLLALDELRGTRRDIQSALLGLVQEKEVGTWRLPAGVRVCGATNDLSESAGAYPLSTAQKTRCMWLPFPTPDDSWDTWLESLPNWEKGDEAGNADSEALRVGELAAKVEEKILRAWPLVWAEQARLVTAYRRNRPEAFALLPREDSEEGYLHVEGVARPRTWEYATQALCACRIWKLENHLREAMLIGLLGVAGRDFSVWLVENDLPDVLMVLAGKAEFVPDERVDRSIAIMSAATGLLAAKPELGAGFIRLLEVVGAKHKEVMAQAIGKASAQGILPRSKELSARINALVPIASRVENEWEREPEDVRNASVSFGSLEDI